MSIEVRMRYEISVFLARTCRIFTPVLYHDPKNSTFVGWHCRFFATAHICFSTVLWIFHIFWCLRGVLKTKNSDLKNVFTWRTYLLTYIDLFIFVDIFSTKHKKKTRNITLNKDGRKIAVQIIMVWFIPTNTLIFVASY